MANIFMRFPGGRFKALTLSYDDGPEADIQMIAIMKQHGLKGSFNLNSGIVPPEGTPSRLGKKRHRRLTYSESLALYKDSGMEIAIHGLTHAYLNIAPDHQCIFEIMQDRLNLEKDFGCMVRGMAHPYEDGTHRVANLAKACGIVYARTGKCKETFDLPKTEDWMHLFATSHHSNPRLMELTRDFVEQTVRFSSLLFSLIGHSWEFGAQDNWHIIDEFAAFVGGRDDIWYATTIEIYDYMNAFDQLIFSADMCTVYNPTNTTIYFQNGENKDGANMYCIHPGETIRLEQLL